MRFLPARHFRAAILAAIALPALVVLGSCDGESPTMCPRTGIGVLEGYLRIDGRGLSRQIGAYALEGPTPGTVTHVAVSDSNGWYRMELPTGLYRLEVDPFNWRSNSSEYLDTIRVLPRVFRFDLKRGAAGIRIRMPEELEEQAFTLYIRDDDSNSTHEQAVVRDGFLVFDFPCLIPSDYYMRLGGGDLIGNWYLPGLRNEIGADLIQVKTREAAVYEADFRDSYASIGGSITGSWQKTGTSFRPSVQVVTPDSLGLGSTHVSGDGTYSCGFLVPREVVLRSNYREVIRWMGGDSFAEARVFDLQPGDRITGVDQVESGIRLRIEGPGELAHHRATVTVRDESGRDLQPASYSENPFSICNLGAGRYFLKVEGFCDDEIWARQWYGGSETEDGAQAIDLAAGELAAVTINLEEGGSIAGTLLRADGTVPLIVQFGLFDAAGQPHCSGWKQWRPFDEGSFGFRGLADGDHYLGVIVEAGQVWWYPGTLEFTEAVPLVIENHAALTGVDWRLP